MSKTLYPGKGTQGQAALGFVSGLRLGEAEYQNCSYLVFSYEDLDAVSPRTEDLGCKDCEESHQDTPKDQVQKVGACGRRAA